MAFIEHLRRNRPKPDLLLAYNNKTGMLRLTLSLSLSKRLEINSGDRVNFYYDDALLKAWKIEKDLTHKYGYKVGVRGQGIKIQITLRILGFMDNDISLKSYSVKDKSLFITLN